MARVVARRMPTREGIFEDAKCVRSDACEARRSCHAPRDRAGTRRALRGARMTHIDLHFELLGRERDVVACSLREGLSQRTEARVVIAAALEDELDGAVTQLATLSV